MGAILNTDQAKYFFRYVTVNFVLIYIILFFTILELSPIYLSVISALIIAGQYPFILRYKSRSVKLFIYYLSFVLFCFSINFIDILNKSAPLNSFEACMGLLVRGGFFIIFGHLYGLIFLPIIIVINRVLSDYFMI